MKSLDPFEFYELGDELRKLKKFDPREDVTVDDVFLPFWRARNWLLRLLANELLEMKHCRQEAQNLYDIVHRIGLNTIWDEDGAIDIEDMNKPVDGFAFWGLGSVLIKRIPNFCVP